MIRTAEADASRVPAPAVQKRYYSEAELSIYSGIPRRTLQSWRLRSIGPPWRKLIDTGKSGSVRYDVQQFDAWVQSCPGGGQQGAA